MTDNAIRLRTVYPTYYHEYRDLSQKFLMSDGEHSRLMRVNSLSRIGFYATFWFFVFYLFFTFVYSFFSETSLWGVFTVSLAVLGASAIFQLIVVSFRPKLASRESFTSVVWGLPSAWRTNEVWLHREALKLLKDTEITANIEDFKVLDTHVQRICELWFSSGQDRPDTATGQAIKESARSIGDSVFRVRLLVERARIEANQKSKDWARSVMSGESLNDTPNSGLHSLRVPAYPHEG